MSNHAFARSTLVRAVVAAAAVTVLALSFAVTPVIPAAAAQGSSFKAPKCPQGFTLEENGNTNQFRCKKAAPREYAHVGCDVGWLHQPLDGKDNCKGLDTTNDQSKLRCVFVNPLDAAGWQYQVMSGGDRCYRDKVEYVTPTF